MKKLVVASFLVVSTLLNSGCLLFVAGGAAAGTAYVLGTLEASLEGDIKKSDYAVTKALKKLELIKVNHSKTALEAVHTYRNAKDDKIVITLEKFTDRTTKIYIKVGIFGDEALSHNILEEVKEKL